MPYLYMNAQHDMDIEMVVIGNSPLTFISNKCREERLYNYLEYFLVILEFIVYHVNIWKNGIQTVIIDV